MRCEEMEAPAAFCPAPPMGPTVKLTARSRRAVGPSLAASLVTQTNIVAGVTVLVSKATRNRGDHVSAVPKASSNASTSNRG